MSTRTNANTDLMTIPGVGPSIESCLVELGIGAVSELRGERLDPCVKYTFRCAVYFASNEVHEPALLQWWNWKERPPRA